MKRLLPWAAFAPSLVAGLVGAAVLAWRPWPFEPRVAPLPAALAGLAVGALLLAVGELLERNVPSFRWASRATDRVLARLGLSRPAASALAVATSLGEELLFRGVLLPTLGLVPQAVLFGLLHPAGRRGWSYPLYACGAALLLGATVLATGRLAPAVLAHLVVNAVGLLGGGSRLRRARRRAPRRRTPPSGPPPT